MNTTIITKVLPAALAVLAIASLAACGGSVAEPTAAPANTPRRPAPPAAAAPSPAQSPVATTTAPATNGGEQLVARGKQVFDKTAGGVGCAYCHQPDAKGNAALGAPDVRRVTETQIYDALATRAQMSFITLTDEEIQAVAAYLQTLEK